MREPEQQLSEEEQLNIDIGSFADDPMGYVMYAFPWDDPASGIQVVPLPEPWRSEYGCEYGPDLWACEFLEQLGEEIRERDFDLETLEPVAAVQTAVKSGHGIGKSALVGMLCCFIQDTRRNSRGTVTANTKKQLRVRTFAEISKWRKLSITSHWWEILDGDMVVRHRSHGKTWRLDCVPWKKEESEAFAGQHEATSSSWYIFDEASAIPEIIYEVSQGGLTDGEPFYFLFGNPTRNEGFFYQCFHKQRHRFFTMQINSMECYLPNKAKMQEWIDDYGADSDFCRVRIFGKNPRYGDLQLISNESVWKAQQREEYIAKDDPLVLGIDPARSGKCESVICPRRGNSARCNEWKCLRRDDSMMLVGDITHYLDALRQMGTPAAATIMDAGGLGGPIKDRVEQLGYDIVGVINSAPATKPERFFDLAAECWWKMKLWIEERGCLPDDPILESQLCGRQAWYDDHNRLRLESKDDMEVRGLESPDRAEALAYTFARTVAPRLIDAEMRQHLIDQDEYDPYARA